MDRPMDFKKIIHLRPSMQSVNVNCIVLDKRPPLESKRVPVTLFLVADESASIVVSIIGEAGHKIQPGNFYIFILTSVPLL